MTRVTNSRRKFLKSSGSVLGASWVAINMPLILSASQTASENKLEGVGFKNISPQEAIELSAIVDQIIPEDESPGATEAGVVYFIDAALEGFMSASAPVFRQGLEELQHKVKSTYPNTSHFSELSSDEQIDVLRSIEDTPFFEMLHVQTMCGMFCLPEYGGNRNHAGWDLIGFNHQHAWQPPFGHYDAAVHHQTSGGKTDNE